MTRPLRLEFATQMAAPMNDEVLSEVPRAQRGPWPSHWILRHESHKQGMVDAYRTGDYTMQEIANHFGVHYATVSRAIKVMENV